MALPLKKPELYGVADGAEPTPGAIAVLRGMRCTCGHVAFPAQSYGCERCGRQGADLSPVTLSGRGRLLSSSRVHMHAAAYPKAPFTVVEVELDEGVAARALLADGMPETLEPGMPVHAVLQAESSGEASTLDLRFAIN